MKNIKITIFLTFMIALFLALNADAKWWIFGQSTEEVAINYLYINKMPFDENGAKITIYKDSLQNGMIVINGKVSVKKGKIGNVKVSIDNKENWVDAKFSDNGSFEYSFTPVQDKIYTIFIEIMDSAGKTNDIEATRKEVIVSEKNIQPLIKEVLDNMIDAYKNEDAERFMSFVSDDFAGDEANLNMAIRKDFSFFDNIDLQYSINNIASGSKGIFVSINYTRRVNSTKTGQSFTDKGATEFVFKLGDKGPKAFSMKNPLIFGLSDSANIATGTLKTSESMIVMDNNGNVTKVPSRIFEKIATDDSLKITRNVDGTTKITASDNTYNLDQNGNIVAAGNTSDTTSGGTTGGSTTGGDTTTTDEVESTVESGTFTIKSSASSSPDVKQGFIFEDNTVVSDWTGDINVEFNLIFIHTGSTALDLGVTSIASVTSVTDAGYKTDPFMISPNIGHCFAFKLTNGKYAVIEIISWTDLGGDKSTANFKYKYQPDGSRNF